MVAACLADGDVAAGSAVGYSYGIALQVPFATVAILGPGQVIKKVVAGVLKKIWWDE